MADFSSTYILSSTFVLATSILNLKKTYFKIRIVKARFVDFDFLILFKKGSSLYTDAPTESNNFSVSPSFLFGALLILHCEHQFSYYVKGFFLTLLSSMQYARIS